MFQLGITQFISLLSSYENIAKIFFGHLIYIQIADELGVYLMYARVSRYSFLSAFTMMFHR